MSDLAPDFTRTVLRHADPVVAAALGLLARGAILNDLVAVFGDADEGLTVTVGPRSELLARTPELELMLCRIPVPLGYLQWVALSETQVALGAIRVAPLAGAEA
jgi:hypothetical protein